MEWFRQNHRFAEFDLHLVERIPGDDFFIFQVVKKSFDRGNLSFYGFGFVLLVQTANIIFQQIRCNIRNIPA